MKTKYLYFSIPFIILITFSIFYFNYNKIDHSFDIFCTKKPINYAFENNLSNYKIISQDLDVYPTINNFFCLGKVINLYTEDDGTNILIYGTNQNVKTLVYFLTSLLIFIFILKKVNIVFLIELLFCFTVFHYQIFDIYFLNKNLFKFLIPILVCYFLLNFSIEQIKVFSRKSLSYLNQKSRIFYLLNFLFMPSYILIIKKEFLVGYWLTNYNYGFIKRGFFGSIIVNLPLNNIEKINIVVLTNLFLYIYCFNLISKLSSYDFNASKLILLLSQFFILGYFYDSGYVGRPEILGILVLLKLLNYKDFNIKNIFVIIIIYNISIYTHEINLFFLLPIIIFNFKKSFKYKIQFFSLLILSSIVFLFIFTNFQKDIQYKQNLICTEIENYNIRDNICDGAISFLTEDEFNINTVLTKFNFNWFTPNHYSYSSYLIPFITMLYILFKFSNSTNYKLILLITLNFFPLFLLTKDWGRWIYLIYLINVIFIIGNFYKISFIVNTKINLLVLSILLFTFFNPHCCSVDSFTIPHNIALNNIQIYLLTFIYLFLKNIFDDNSSLFKTFNGIK